MHVPQMRDIKAPPPVPVAETQTQETTREVGAGVLLTCVREGGELRVRVASPGYHPDWHVQFPRNLRQEGARYVVDAVHEAARGNFYRTLGDIRRLG
jgi:hypothetical protein